MTRQSVNVAYISRVHHIETVDPRTAVLDRLRAAHTRYIAIERKAWRMGETVEAEGAHQMALWILRAYAAERDDPMPGQLIVKRYPPKAA